DQFHLQRREEALGDGIVPAITATAHTADDPVLRQRPLVVPARILTPAIRMMQQAAGRAPAGPRQREGLQSEGIRDVLAHAPPSRPRSASRDRGSPPGTTSLRPWGCR